MTVRYLSNIIKINAKTNSSSIFFKHAIFKNDFYQLNPFINCDVLNIVNYYIYMVNSGVSNLFKDEIFSPIIIAIH